MPLGKQPRAFDRTPGQPFHDLGREQYAVARAKGATIKAAAQEAGANYRDCQDWDKHPEMLERIRELRQRTTQFVDVSVGYILNELKKNAEIARDEGQLKSSNEALKIMYDIIRTDPSIANNMARQLPPTMSTKSIKAQLLKSLKGETAPVPPSVETTAEPVESGPGDDDEHDDDTHDDEAAQ